MGYFHDAAKMLVPSITEIEGIAGSKKAFSLKIDGKEFRLNRINTVTRLSFIRRLGAMLEELDIGLLNSMGKAAAFKSKGMDADAFREYPRELSNVALTTQLLVKSVGKTSQCIDKICNLQ